MPFRASHGFSGTSQVREHTPHLGLQLQKSPGQSQCNGVCATTKAFVIDSYLDDGVWARRYEVDNLVDCCIAASDYSLGRLLLA
jgi:hypothetical protein